MALRSGRSIKYGLYRGQRRLPPEGALILGIELRIEELAAVSAAAAAARSTCSGLRIASASRARVISL